MTTTIPVHQKQVAQATTNRLIAVFFAMMFATLLGAAFGMSEWQPKYDIRQHHATYSDSLERMEQRILHTINTMPATTQQKAANELIDTIENLQ